eukprot:477346_1
MSLIIIWLLDLLLYANNVKAQISSGFSPDNSILFPLGGVGRLSYASTEDNKFYIFAGSGGNYRWDPSSPNLLTTLQTSTSISHCWTQCATYMANKKIYIMGQEASGYGVVEIFDTESEQFINHNITIPIPLRIGCAAGDYENGLIYYYGGQNESYQTTQKIFTTLQVFNIYTEQWTQLASNIAATTPFIRTTCIYTPNGYFFTFGGTTGWSNNNAINDAYRYDILDNSWAKLTSNSLPYSVFHARSIYNKGDDKVYIIGGDDESATDTYLQSVTQFNPNSNQMITQNSLSVGVDTCAVNIVGDIIRVWGGRYNVENAKSNTQFATIATSQPSTSPTHNPSIPPTKTPSKYPSKTPTNEPTIEPTIHPTKVPSVIPTMGPTMGPTYNPTFIIDSTEVKDDKIEVNEWVPGITNTATIIICVIISAFCLLCCLFLLCLKKKKSQTKNEQSNKYITDTVTNNNNETETNNTYTLIEQKQNKNDTGEQINVVNIPQSPQSSNIDIDDIANTKDLPDDLEESHSDEMYRTRTELELVEGHVGTKGNNVEQDEMEELYDDTPGQTHGNTQDTTFTGVL